MICLYEFMHQNNTLLSLPLSFKTRFSALPLLPLSSTMAEETPVEVPVEETPIIDETPETLEDAIRIVIRKSYESNGLVRGLSEVTRALDKRNVHLAVLADDCDDEEYKKLVTALAKQGNIDLINVESREKLAEWAGLSRVKPASGETKIVKCSCIAIREFGERSRALDYLMAQLGQ
ncbi:small subunit ribosomal protein S12e [Angomonas deanei]|uniref:40S ribosomal protein S12 n=1 Tax=Angomonas deanei TaxID=59799 RepID=A0A7G2CKS0_9TRYP|nr:small subunit ribosomal protein S12e [Angomonas deanei]CAD2219541.1 Ribosomal protein L7Ae/L30e/S12e/Gadd45 family, putative [Angomonas deanei]|eukprot:EPY33990.1 small subunit ribosomal protein S12e [Angomonas deanei]